MLGDALEDLAGCPRLRRETDACAAIALDQEGAWVTVTAVGAPVAEVLCLPLVYQGAPIGQLILGPRASSRRTTPGASLACPGIIANGCGMR